ncbi:MAG: class II fumarate hydratase [Candidatus Heimdallarchaeota archaeon]|nr:class II fumarate hydratase [Candidatus Heimdallarchaeota archaeon]MCK4769444.1 class II fumarate hydratase [Candidatus Heimdallarchaeota archaeon]
MKNNTRKEKDILGELEIPDDVYWGISTQRAINNFQISGKTFSYSFIHSLALVKKACLLANMELKLIEQELGEKILETLDDMILEDKFLDQFPLDVFQSGSGTQTNMNMNEVVSNITNEKLGRKKGGKEPVHPNDHVNRSQSSNDVIPTTMHLSTIHVLQKILLPVIRNTILVLTFKIDEFKDIIKVSRTHLQDAVPIPLSLEFEVYKKQLEISEKRIFDSFEELLNISLGGTAVGTGINAPKNFSELAIKHLSKITGFSFTRNPVQAEGISSHNAIVNISGILKALALSLMNMANDIRWMGSGPRAGLGELFLPENEPGSSIMPGKINPTQAEMLIQVCIQVIGNDSIITMAEGYGNVLDLNVAKPIMIVSLLESIDLLSNAISSFSDFCLYGLKPNKERIEQLLELNLMVVTNLSKEVGYDKASEIAKEAYRTGKTIKEIVREMNLDIDVEEILDPKKMI